VLFPQDQDASWYDDSHDHDELLTDEDDDRSQGSDVVIPWTSPDTRLRKRETFLQKFSQKFNDPEDETPIDPQLSSVGGAAPAASTDDIHFTSSLVHGNVSSTRADVPIKQEHTLSSTTQNYSSEPFTVALQQRHPASVRAPNHSRNSSAVTVTQSNATASMPHPIHRVAKTAKRKEDGDQDEDHPQKKLKPSPRVGFRDNQMPDIFVAAYPEVYNRDTKSLYQSCETEHRDISTLV
jgi:cation transport regulator ChaB